MATVPSPFAAVAQPPSWGAIAGQGFSAVAQPPEQRGIIGSIVHELGADVLGGARVAGATAGELAGLLGFSAPLRYDDLSSRDVKGAMLLAALGAGGLAGGAARGLLGAANTVGGRALGTFMSEAVAGAAFGLVAPLDEDQSRLGSVAGQAALGGAVGMGASFIKSAAMATVGSRIAAIKAAGSRAAMMAAAKGESDELILREAAGVRLRNNASGEQIGIRRMGDGSVNVTVYKPGAKAATSTAADFGTAVASAVRDGFSDDLRPYDPKRMLKGITSQLDSKTLDMLNEHGGDITEALGVAELGKYKAVRQAAELSAQFKAEMTALVGETIAPANALGVPQLNAATKEGLLRELKVTGLAAAKMSDGDVLREASRQGLVSISNLTDGAALSNFMEELFINDALPASMRDIDITVNPHRDAVLTSILLPSRIAKWFPEVAPVTTAADMALQAIEKAQQANKQWLFDLKDRVGYEAATMGRDIIHVATVDAGESATPEAIAQAVAQSRQLAMQQAAATGNAEVMDFVGAVVPKLEEMLARHQAAGVLGEGLSGYFPIVNGNKWKLDVTDWAGEAKLDFAGFHATKAEADAELARLRTLNANVGGMITPRSFSLGKGVRTGIDPAQIGSMRKALIEAYSVAFGPEGAKDAAATTMEQRFYVKAAAPAKSMNAARRRVLGLQDFSRDPFEALDIYLDNSERTLALRTFEQQARPIIDALPASQANLKRWGGQYIDDILGRPRDSERAFDAIMDHLGLDVQPRALRRYTGALRGWESFSRLGGFWSGVVNMTQIPLNTYPVLGARWTAKGMEALLHPKEAIQTLFEHGVDLGMYVPMSDAGEGARLFFGGPVAAFKEKRYVEAAKRISLYVFNGAERTNRLVTAWGAFQRELAQGSEAKAAAAVAQTVLDRTQFNYRMSNMPELLRGPVGALMLQFKSFVINELEFISSLSGKEAMRFGQAVSALGGISMLFNMPGPDLADTASQLWTGEKLSEGLKEKAHESAAWRTVAFGLPGAIGIDLSDTLGVGNIADITAGIMGPFGKDMTALVKYAYDATVDHAATGRVSDEVKNVFLQTVAPSALRRLQRGVDIARTGEVRQPYSGKVLYQPQQRMREAFWTAIGPSTVDAQYELAANAIVERSRAAYSRAHTSFAKDAAMALLQGDSARYAGIIAEAQAAGHYYSGADIRNWTMEMQRPAAQRRERRTPKAQRAELQRLFEMSGSTAPLL